MSRPSFDEMGMATAALWATRSADPYYQVGACILDEHHRMVSVGYNGRAPGEPNEREDLTHPDGRAQGFSGLLHAEENALLHANWNGRAHTMYLTHAPCALCARRILATHRITRVVYATDYRERYRESAGLPSGPDILQAHGIVVERL